MRASRLFRRTEVAPELQPAHDRFAAQVRRLEQARRAMLSCLPVGRVAPAPVHVGLDLLDDELASIAADLDGWRVDAVEDAWQACRDAVEESRAAIPRAHQVARSSGELEELLGAVEDVDEPLSHAWQRAERAWAALRRPVSRRR